MTTERPQSTGFFNPFNWGKKKKKEEPKPSAEAPPPVIAEPSPPAATPPPATTPPPPAAAAERTYTVVAGDTLWDIAVKYYGDGQKYRKIAAANNIENPDQIDIGLELKIPE